MQSYRLLNSAPWKTKTLCLIVCILSIIFTVNLKTVHNKIRQMRLLGAITLPTVRYIPNIPCHMFHREVYYILMITKLLRHARKLDNIRSSHTLRVLQRGQTAKKKRQINLQFDQYTLHVCMCMYCLALCSEYKHYRLCQLHSALLSIIPPWMFLRR